MDAVEFLKTEKRMCESYGICSGCPIRDEKHRERLSCDQYMREYPEKTVAIVEKWLAEHPIKTRQSEFLKMFPNAQTLRNGALVVCPKVIDLECGINCNKSCRDCRKEYWLEEID